MGHTRLGKLPRTRRWGEVVALIAGGASTAQIANATIHAAEQGLSGAAKDVGVVETIWLLMQLPHAARTDNFVEALDECDLSVSDTPSLMEIVAAVTEAIDARMPNCRGRTDLGEMAQLAAGETLTATIGQRIENLFGPTTADVQHALAALATSKQFSSFAKAFFARFTTKCMTYFLSRTLADHLGDGQRFTTLAQQAAFIQALDTHCHEAAYIVERFSGDWYSKTKWETKGQLTQEAIAAFTGGAMKKLIAELQQGAGPDGD